MRKATITFLTAAVFTLSACGGRTANPVMVNQYGDQNKNCKAIEFEMTSIQGEIQRLLPKKDKTGKNVALGVAGWFLIVPWFFMDFKNAEATEYEAYRQRYNHLGAIAMGKNCSLNMEEYPSIEEMKAAYEEAQKEEREKSSQGTLDRD